MTAPRIVDPGAVLGQALSDASPDLMRHLLGTVINSLLSAEADAVCGAEWGQPSPERVAQRNGYRHRDLLLDSFQNGPDLVHVDHRSRSIASPRPGVW